MLLAFLLRASPLLSSLQGPASPSSLHGPPGLNSQVPAAPEVQWTAPAECPDRAALLAAVTRRLGRPFAAEARVDARVTGDRFRGYALHLELAVDGRAEVRDVQDPSCAALTDAAAVRVVAAIEAPVVPAPPELPPHDPEPAQTPAQAPTPAPTAEVDPTEPVVTTPTPAPVPAPTDMYDGPGALLRVHGGGELGASPAIAGAVGLAAGLLWPRLRLELHGTVLPRREGSDVQAALYTGAVHACGRIGRGVLEVPLCGGLEVGGMRGTAVGLPGARTATFLWIGAVVGPALAWHVRPRLSVWAGLQLVLALRRPQFVQGDDPPVELFTPSRASGRFLLGLELRLRDRW